MTGHGESGECTRYVAPASSSPGTGRGVPARTRSLDWRVTGSVTVRRASLFPGPLWCPVRRMSCDAADRLAEVGDHFQLAAQGTDVVGQGGQFRDLTRLDRGDPLLGDAHGRGDFGLATGSGWTCRPHAHPRAAEFRLDSAGRD